MLWIYFFLGGVGRASRARRWPPSLREAACLWEWGNDSTSLCRYNPPTYSSGPWAPQMHVCKVLGVFVALLVFRLCSYSIRSCSCCVLFLLASSLKVFALLASPLLAACCPCVALWCLRGVLVCDSSSGLVLCVLFVLWLLLLFFLFLFLLLFACCCFLSCFGSSVLFLFLLVSPLVVLLRCSWLRVVAVSCFSLLIKRQEDDGMKATRVLFPGFP